MRELEDAFAIECGHENVAAAVAADPLRAVDAGERPDHLSFGIGKDVNGLVLIGDIEQRFARGLAQDPAGGLCRRRWDLRLREGAS